MFDVNGSICWSVVLFGTFSYLWDYWDTEEIAVLLFSENIFMFGGRRLHVWPVTSQNPDSS